MKAFLAIYLCFFVSVCSRAQDFAPDSSITTTKVAAVSQPISEKLSIKGQIDAEKHYRKYKGASVGTLITSLVSPLLGLIPAIASGSSTPKLKNLGYPDEKLFQQADYHASYTRKAKKIKQKKVWTNWGIGLGVNLAIVIAAAAGQ